MASTQPEGQADIQAFPALREMLPRMPIFEEVCVFYNITTDQFWAAAGQQRDLEFVEGVLTLLDNWIDRTAESAKARLAVAS